jgi:hypothetical protein
MQVCELYLSVTIAPQPPAGDLVPFYNVMSPWFTRITFQGFALESGNLDSVGLKVENVINLPYLQQRKLPTSNSK